MNTRITQRSVEAAKPPASGYVILSDDKLDGFGIRVTAAGAKSFVLNYRVANGDKRRYTIGSWPEWTADAARDEAANVLLPAINKEGADPVRDKKALREEPALRARCRAGSSMWMARKRNAPLVHWAFSAHPPQRLRVPM